MPTQKSSAPGSPVATRRVRSGSSRRTDQRRGRRSSPAARRPGNDPHRLEARSRRTRVIRLVLTTSSRSVTKSPRSTVVCSRVGSAPRSISSEVMAYEVVSSRPSGVAKNPSLSCLGGIRPDQETPAKQRAERQQRDDRADYHQQHPTHRNRAVHRYTPAGLLGRSAAAVWCCHGRSSTVILGRSLILTRHRQDCKGSRPLRPPCGDPRPDPRVAGPPYASSEMDWCRTGRVLTTQHTPIRGHPPGSQHSMGDDQKHGR